MIDYFCARNQTGQTRWFTKLQACVCSRAAARSVVGYNSNRLPGLFQSFSLLFRVDRGIRVLERLTQFPSESSRAFVIGDCIVYSWNAVWWLVHLLWHKYSPRVLCHTRFVSVMTAVFVGIEMWDLFFGLLPLLFALVLINKWQTLSDNKSISPSTIEHFIFSPVFIKFYRLITHFRRFLPNETEKKISCWSGLICQSVSVPRLVYYRY